MQDEFDLEGHAGQEPPIEEATPTSDEEEQADEATLYKLAGDEMRRYIRIYLDLSRRTNGLTAIEPKHVESLSERIVILGGIDSSLNPEATTSRDVVMEWERVRAVPFDVELAITKGVYVALRDKISVMLAELEKATQGFLKFDAAYISDNPRMLPILQRLANITSKAQLKRQIGSVSDNTISGPAASKLAAILDELQPGQSVTRPQLLQSIEPTLEGIVRDLVGRVLLESIVANALDDAKVSYKRESEYDYIAGVVYNFRADFVIPDDRAPKAFIEVRKSSSRHASLYAKDKMFSAINWKGKNTDLLAVLVVYGPWTGETLRVMTRVFDYVVPLTIVSDVAAAISAYLQGDRSRLKWLIEFAIHPAN